MKAVVRAVVIVLAVVIGAAPVLLNNCLMTCHGDGSGVAGAQAPHDESWHHSRHSGPLCAVQTAPAACGHDHGPAGAVIAAEGATTSPLKPAYAPVALITPDPAFTPTVAVVAALPSERSPGSTVTSPFAAPLRI